jgi:hypothetical protein
MSVEPNSDVTTRAEIASLDRIRNVSVSFREVYRTSPNLGRQFGSGAWRTLRKFHFPNDSFVAAAQHPPPS